MNKEQLDYIESNIDNAEAIGALSFGWADTVRELVREMRKDQRVLLTIAEVLPLLNGEERRLKSEIFKSNETHLEMFAEIERLKENNKRLKIALENEQSQFAKRNEENTRLRRVLMNIESAKRLHSGIPWEAMVMTLQDIARQGLKGGEG